MRTMTDKAMRRVLHITDSAWTFLLHPCHPYLSCHAWRPMARNNSDSHTHSIPALGAANIVDLFECKQIIIKETFCHINL